MAHKHRQVNVRIPADLLAELKRLDVPGSDSTTKKVVAALRFALAKGWPPKH